MRFGRTLLAFLIAPLATPVILIAVLGVGPLFQGNWSILTGLGPYLWLFTILTYPSVILLGVPSLLLFRRFHFESALAYAVGGAVIGLATAAIWVAVFRSVSVSGVGSDARLGVGLFAFFCVLAGCVSALLFRRLSYAGT